METEIRVGDCMRKGIVALDSNDTVYDAAKIMSDSAVGSVIVIKDNKAVGIVTERDIVRKVITKKKNPASTELETVMSTPLRIVPIDMPVGDAIAVMKKNSIKKLPVMNGNKLVGMITETDILRTYPSLIDLMIEKEIIKRYDPSQADLSHYRNDI